jgi:hypothetical protein
VDPTGLYIGGDRIAIREISPTGTAVWKFTSGAQVWNKSIPADCQAVVRVHLGHRPPPATSRTGTCRTPTSEGSSRPRTAASSLGIPGHRFAVQRPPRHGGIQAACPDSITKPLFLRSDFTQWNETLHKLLVAFRWNRPHGTPASSTWPAVAHFSGVRPVAAY